MTKAPYLAFKPCKPYPSFLLIAAYLCMITLCQAYYHGDSIDMLIRYQMGAVAEGGGILVSKDAQERNSESTSRKTLGENKHGSVLSSSSSRDGSLVTRTHTLQVSTKNLVPLFALEKTISVDWISLIRKHVKDLNPRQFDAELQEYQIDSSNVKKVSFIFANNKFQTPWLELFNAKGQQLQKVKFDFSFTGTYVTGFSWQSFYSPAGTSQQRSEVHLTTKIIYKWKSEGLVSSSFGFTVFLALATIGALTTAFLIFSNTGKRRYVFVPGEVRNN